MTLSTARLARLAAGAVAIIVAGSSCRPSTAPPASRSVAFHVSASTASLASTAVTSPLEIISVRIIVGGVALGGGDQFGCVDCQGNDGERAAMPPQVVAVPLDGSTTLVTTEGVNVGRYSQVEISLDAPTAAILAANPGWPAGATILVTGRYNGTPFTLPLAVAGSFRQSLLPPVDVAASSTAGTLTVRLTLPIASWFTWNGTLLNPTVATQRAQIETNARASFQATDAAEPSNTEP